MTDDDPITRADLTRELHYMQTQVEQHGFPGTRAVLAELERLHAENGKLRAEVDRLRDFILGPDVELSMEAHQRFCTIDATRHP